MEKKLKIIKKYNDVLLLRTDRIRNMLIPLIYIICKSIYNIKFMIRCIEEDHKY